MLARLATLGFFVACCSLCAAGSTAAVPRPEHPRPDFERRDWVNLNGEWGFRFDPEGVGEKERWFAAGAGGFDEKTVVPFPWESELSGVKRPDYRGAAWYRRTFEAPDEWRGRRVALKFCAVDWEASVWLNGELLGKHAGGYSPFEFDITERLRWDSANTLVVRAFDVVDRETPTGKQTGWYTPTSGIWQTVYLEATGSTYIAGLRIVTELDGRVRFRVDVERAPTAGRHEDVPPTNSTSSHSSRATAGRREDAPPTNSTSSYSTSSHSAAEAEVRVVSMDGRFRRVGGEVRDGGAEVEVRVRDPQLWTPETPVLYPALVQVWQDGEKVDEVKTYFGIRTVGHGRYEGSDFEYVLLNGKPVYLRGALDQSFNPRGIYTAPSDEFMRRDMEIARDCGLNFLRIHIKVDEPRRLYWADKLGVMLMCDMPNTRSHSRTAERNWEMTLRDAVARDFNHPSIIAWCDFNEEWGIGRADAAREHRVDWVERMYELTKELDPTRLSEDNSGWRHLKTDLNSFHVYTRDVDALRRQAEERCAEIRPGSEWNYFAGRKQQGEPYINSEYGYVSAGGGDGDWSWGLLGLTNGLRRQECMVGYVYTELTDIEWEHNGLVNYDRTPKEVGYEAWAPGMTVADVFGSDFLVLDVPPMQTVEPGATVTVPTWLSYYSARKWNGVRLKWQVNSVDRLGRETKGDVREAPVRALRPYRLNALPTISVELPDEPGLAWLAAWLADETGDRIAVNFCHFEAWDGPAWRAEALDARTLALRFRPEDYAEAKWSHEPKPKRVPPPSKYYGFGHGYVEYRLEVPHEVDASDIVSMTLRFEAASKADREKVDWPSRVRREDYPQTDGKKWPSDVSVSLNGERIAALHLPDDPADCRGVLSHFRGREQGSYGYLQRIRVDLQRGGIRRLLATRRLRLRFTVPKNAPNRGGFALYGERMGRWPIEPTVLLRFEHDLPVPSGWSFDEPVARDTAAERTVTILPTAEEGGARWRYVTEAPPDGWEQPDHDDHAWKAGPSGFGRAGTPGAIIGRPWTTKDIWLRWSGTVPEIKAGDNVMLRWHHDEDAEVYVNGELLVREGGYLTSYREVVLDEKQKGLFRQGRNVIAAHCRQTVGGQFVDVGISIIRGR